MKKLLFIPLVLFLISGTFQTTHFSSAVSIHDLVASRQMNFTPQTNGGYNQGSITVTLESLTRSKKVLIPMGTRFTSALSEEQDLILPEDVIVDVPGNGEKKVTLDAYCVQHSNLSPDADQTFGFTAEKDKNLMKILQFMQGKNYHPSVVQNAIWSITDGENVAGISMNDPEEKALREFICETTGMENVWYDLDREYRQTESREIIPETKQVAGDIAYEVNETGKVVLQVVEEDGTVIRELGGGMPITHTGSYKFRFSMKVQGWDRGLYFVQLKLADDVFHKVTFEV